MSLKTKAVIFIVILVLLISSSLITLTYLFETAFIKKSVERER